MASLGPTPVRKLAVLEFVLTTQVVLRQSFRIGFKFLGINRSPCNSVEDLSKGPSRISVIGRDWRKIVGPGRSAWSCVLDGLGGEWSEYALPRHKGKKEAERPDLILIRPTLVPSSQPVQELRAGCGIAHRGGA